MLGPFYFLTKSIENDLLLFVYHSGGKTMVRSGDSMIPVLISTQFISAGAFLFSSH